MSISFGRFYSILLEAEGLGGQTDTHDTEPVEDQEGPLLDSGEDSKAMEIIRSGLNLRKEECGSFWDDFVQMCSNADSMAELLEVPREKVTSWAGRIKELISQVSDKDDTEAKDDKKNSKLVPTGNDPDMSADPMGNNGYEQPDMRPLPS